jgi:5-methylcytosine-specific restriction endonuclease McrA
MPYKPKKKKRSWIKEKPAFEGAPTQKFYWSKAWRNLRKRYLAKNPVCKKCKVKAAVICDHIKPINPLDAYDLQGGVYPHPLDESNIQGLCRSCDAKKMSKASKKKII